MKSLIVALLHLLASAMSGSVNAEKTVYEGTIGQYKIHMVLDDDFEGYYYYDHRPESRFKLVKSHVADEDDECEGLSCFILQEYAPGTNKNTGEFLVEFNEHFPAGGYYHGEIYGTWRNKSNGKTLPIYVSCLVKTDAEE
ncbi:MAG: hypothetical protein J6R26_02800 [Paludibacteraceae bacterium]|nr:hypothetical protein [Paludibacteraceae bacterium]